MSKKRFDKKENQLVRVGSPYKITDQMKNDAFRRRKEDGMFVVDAIIGKVGVNEYVDYEGEVIKEARLPEHLFDEMSMRSGNDVSVTMLHPAWFVDEHDRYEVERGHVVYGVKPSDDKLFLLASLAIGGKELQDRIMDGEFCEISPAYYAQVDFTPGIISGLGDTVDGQEYDGFQHSIRYNHIAIGTHNWGRAGEDVRVVLDSKHNVIIPSFDGVARKKEHKDDNMNEFEITVNGVTYTLKGDKSAHMAITKLVEDSASDVARLTSDNATLTEKVDSLEGKLAAETKRADQLSDPSHLAELAARRASVIADAKTIAPKSDFDGLKTDTDIMVAALEGSGNSVKADIEGKSAGFVDSFVAGTFGAQVKIAKSDVSKDGHRIVTHKIGDSKGKRSPLEKAILKDSE